MDNQEIQVPLPHPSNAANTPWYLSPSSTSTEHNPIQAELKYTHQKLRHVHNLLQLKTEESANIMKETFILQKSCAELRDEMYAQQQTIEKQNDIILTLEEEKLNSKPSGLNAALSLQFAIEKNQELNDIIKDLKAQKETLKIYLAKVDNYSVRVERENKSIKKQMERLKAIKQVDTQNERQRLDEWKSYVQLMDTKMDKYKHVDTMKQDEIENLNFMLREKHFELDNTRRLTKSTIETANHTRDTYIVQMKEKNTLLEKHERKEKLLTDQILEVENKNKVLHKKLKKQYAIATVLEKDLLKSEKLVGKHERIIIALQEEIKLLVDKLSAKFEINYSSIATNDHNVPVKHAVVNNKNDNITHVGTSKRLEKLFCIKIFIESDRIKIDDGYKYEIVDQLKQQLIRNDVEVDNIWFPETKTDGYDSGEVVITLLTKNPRLEEDINKLFLRLQKNNFPDIVMKTILPPISIAWWNRMGGDNP